MLGARSAAIGQERRHPRNLEGDDDQLIGVALLDSGDDVLLASRQGKAIRFAADDIREFQSRTSTRVRGKGITNIDSIERNGPVVASFSVRGELVEPRMRCARVLRQAPDGRSWDSA